MVTNFSIAANCDPPNALYGRCFIISEKRNLAEGDEMPCLAFWGMLEWSKSLGPCLSDLRALVFNTGCPSMWGDRHSLTSCVISVKLWVFITTYWQESDPGTALCFLLVSLCIECLMPFTDKLYLHDQTVLQYSDHSSLQHLIRGYFSLLFIRGGKS